VAEPRFPVFDRFAYLNAGAVGPISEATVEAMAAADRLGMEQGRGSHGGFAERVAMRGELRERIGALIGVPPATVAITTSTTQGCEIVVGGFGLQPGDEVVTSDAEHPGLEGTLYASPATIKVAAVLGKSPGEAVEAVLGAVTERTRLIALSHVLWLNGQVLPIADIKARSGLPVLVDGAQSVGAIDVDATIADYYTVSGQKWLCGPELTGALYVAEPESLQPRRAPSPWSAPRSQAAHLELAFHPRSLIAGFLTALAERPPDAAARGAAVTEACRRALEQAGIEVLTAANQSRLVAFRLSGDPEEVVGACQEQGVVIRHLPNGWLRASCGWWNSPADVDRLVSALASRPGA
jgi:L-cysteine/cystine lyase